jgi:hypothetical protein
MTASVQANFVVKNGLTVGNTVVLAANGTFISNLTSTGVASGTYGGSSQIPVITVGPDGRLSTAANVTVNIPSGTLVYANSGQLTSNSVSGTGNVLLGLATTGVSAGYYGGITSYPAISVDQYGRITSVVNVASSSSNTAIFTNVDEFTANGAGTTFVLSDTPFNANNVLININGVTQQKPTFTLSGSTIILTEPPVNGATVEVAYSYNSNNLLLVANTTVTPGTYGGSTNIPVLVVNQYGQVTSASNTSIYVPPGTAVFANSGQLTSNSATGTGNVLLGLATAGTAGTYANANTVAVITTDAYGRVSAVTNTAIQIAIAQVTGLQGVTDSQNTNTTAAGSYANSAFTTANSAGVYANGAYGAANASFGQANSAASYANSAFSTANSAGAYANSAFTAANSAGSYANSAFGVANSASIYANGAFVQANAAFTTANSAGVYANGAYGAANAAFGAANSAGSYANSAFTTANSKFSSSGGTISGNVTISGSLSVTGNITYTGNVINQTITGNTGQFFGQGANGFGALYAGVPTGYVLEPQTVIQSTGNYNDYVQINLQNLNNGANATADYTATSDNGSVNDGYIDMGITSSTYSNPTYNLFGPNDGYVYAAGNTTTGGGNLIFYTNTPKDIVFAANGAATGNEIARFKYNTGLVLKSLPITFADSTTQNTAAAPFSFSNSIFVQANSAYSTANAAGSYANSAFLAANSAGSYSNSAFTTANSAGIYANGAYAAANAGFNTANSASSYANGAFVQANSAYSTANAAGSYANSAFTTANSAGSYANAAFLQANSAYAHSNTTSNTFVGTNGTTAAPTNSSLTFASNNGILVSGTGNTITISSPQDLRTTASPSFVALTVNTFTYVSSTIYTTGNVSQNTIDQFSVSTYRSAKYQAQMTSGSAYHMIELNVISDGTTPYLAQYGEIFTSASLGTFDVSITAGNLYLLFTPTNAVTTIKLMRTAITV